MVKNIKKVAVLGSGIMGSGIACHLANVGIEVLLLDIIPENFKTSQNKNERNSIVNKALTAAVKSKPSAIRVFNMMPVSHQVLAFISFSTTVLSTP